MFSCKMQAYSPCVEISALPTTLGRGDKAQSTAKIHAIVKVRNLFIEVHTKNYCIVKSIKERRGGFLGI